MLFNLCKSADTYRVDDPRGTVPGRSVHGGPQVEEENRHDTSTSQVVGGVLLWLNDIYVCTDDPHADGAGDTTDQQKLPSSELVDKEEQPHKGHDGLNHTEHAGQQVDSVLLDADTLITGLATSWMADISLAGLWTMRENGKVAYLENGRGVVVDGIDA